MNETKTSAAQWRLTQGVGFLASVVARCAYLLENASLEQQGRQALQLLHQGVEEAAALLPYVQQSAENIFDGADVHTSCWCAPSCCRGGGIQSMALLHPPKARAPANIRIA
jgi:hypothetical protein